MAQIVNDATSAATATAQVSSTTQPVQTTSQQAPVEAPVEKEDTIVLRKRARKSLYDHVSFKSLYEYSDTIESIRDRSKLALTKHIEAHKMFWRALHERVGTYINLDTTHPLFSNNGAIQGAKNVNGYGIHSLPIPAAEVRNSEGDDVPQEGYKIVSSLIHIVDGYNGSSFSWDICKKIHDNLTEYLQLGIFPVVDMPIPYMDQLGISEKYEHVKHEHDVGIVIDLQVEACPDDTCQLFAVVLWNCNYTDEYAASMYGCFSGYISMVDTLSLPKPWAAINDVSNLYSVGVPVFEYRPNTLELQFICDNHELRDLINTALTTGQVNFDFVDHLIARMQSMTEAMRPVDPATEKPEPTQHAKIEVSDGSSNPVATQQEVEAFHGETRPAYEGSDQVPVEDASTIDEVGRRMRLYDGDADDADPEPIYNAFRVDEDNL